MTDAYLDPRVTEAAIGVSPDAAGLVFFQRGTGFIGGSFPDGITNDGGVPVSARVLARVRSVGKAFDGSVIGSTTSGVDGVWQLSNLPVAVECDIIGRYAGRNDVIASAVRPVSNTELKLVSTLAVSDDKHHVTGTVEVYGGKPPFALTTSGSIPPGITLALDGATITPSGTATASGTYTFSVNVSAANGLTASASMTAVVRDASADVVLSGGFTVDPTNSRKLTGSVGISGGTAPYYIKLLTTGAPTGLVFALSGSTISVSGVALRSGTFNWKIVVIDSAGTTVTGSYSMSVPVLDTNIASVVLNMQMDGTAGSTTFQDAVSTRNATVYANVAISTARSAFGGASAYFGSGSSYLEFPSSTNYDLGTNYTIEFFIQPDSLASNFGVIHRGYYTTTSASWDGLACSIRWIGSACRFYFYGTTNANEQYIDVAGAFSTTEMRYVVMRRTGTTGEVLINSTLAGTINGLNTPAASTRALKIGVWDYSASAEYFKGHLDSLRITRVSRSPIVTPTDPFPIG